MIKYFVWLFVFAFVLHLFVRDGLITFNQSLAIATILAIFKDGQDKE